MAAGAAVFVACALSLAVGSRALAPADVGRALIDPHAPYADIVRGLRVPRTLLGLAAGAALGLAGTVMQRVTRNPLADPGLLGVNAGASLFVIAAITWFGATGPLAFVWFALAGSAVATVLVYVIAARGPGGPTPFRLALAGAALTAAATALVTLVLVTSRTTLQEYRFWSVGSLGDPDPAALRTVAALLAVGALLALTVARSLDALALGEDAARGLGVDVRRAQLVLATAVVLLCGGATALVGPIAFVGLAVAHIVRRLAPHDARRALLLSAAAGPVLLLCADVLGRVIAPPGELEAGIVAAFLGAPVMIALIRGGRVAAR